MNFDRNTIIGFVVLAILFAGYFFYTSKEQAAYRQAKAKTDSIAQANRPAPDKVTVRTDSVRTDSFRKAVSAGGFSASINGSEQVTIIENEVARFGFTNRGGQPKWVELKRFKSADSTPVRLAASQFDKFSYTVSTGANKTAAITDFYFTPEPAVKN